MNIPTSAHFSNYVEYPQNIKIWFIHPIRYSHVLLGVFFVAYQYVESLHLMNGGFSQHNKQTSDIAINAKRCQRFMFSTRVRDLLLRGILRHRNLVSVEHKSPPSLTLYSHDEIIELKETSLFYSGATRKAS